MKRIVLFIILIIVSACQTEEPVIVKQDISSPDDPIKEPELLEKENNKDEVVEEFIEFSIPNEKIVVNLTRVPILKEYIHTMDNKEDVISKMNLVPINTDFGNIYLLEFSCDNELCSYLLFNQNEDNQAFLIADLAKHKYTSLSPDNKKLLFKFNRNTSYPIGLSNLIVVDLENWSIHSLYNKEDKSLDVLHYKYPIITAEWVDEQTITIAIPDVTDNTNNESLLDWSKNGSPTVEYTLYLN